MDITINGTASGTDTAGKTIGQALSEIDERLEAAGAIIVGVRVDGIDVDADSLAGAAERDAGGPGTIELAAEPAADMKARAVETLLELVTAAASAGTPEGIAAVRGTWDSFRSAFGGLFSAEEESFMDAFGVSLSGGAAGNDGTATGETGAKLSAFFGERLAELRSPAEAMRSASRVFDAIRDDLAEVSVRLQTGKDAEAMKTMVVAVELINKTVRIMPLFVHAVPAAAAMTIGGKSIADFYTEFNDSLRELAGAFEAKDGVLIGDLAEYEMLPRLDAFFRAIRDLPEAP